MKRNASTAAVLTILLGGGATAALAQAPAPAASTTGVRAEFLRLMDDAGNKLVRLAEVIPAEKYTWRPGEGVRSVSELFLHVAAGNYNILRRVGAQPPAGLDLRGLEKSTTDKAKVVETLRQSFEFVRQAAMKLTDADMEKTAQWFGGRDATYREILFFLATHEHEHLGQSIAYARMNGVVPPWTEEQQQRARQQQPAKNQ